MMISLNQTAHGYPVSGIMINLEESITSTDFVQLALPVVAYWHACTYSIESFLCDSALIMFQNTAQSSCMM